MAAVELRQRRRVMVKHEQHEQQEQQQDDDSDSEEPSLVLKRADGAEAQIIHSGHFMVSSPHIEHPPKKGYDFDTVNKQTCQTYRFGKASTAHFSIDASLTKLFECMTLAYSGKLVSPKWKNFKGLKLLWRDKIRLNNAIWRAWYMQYVEKRENPVCHFVTPLDGSVTSETIATEGKYWKRRIEIVIREYHKWRTYFKKRLQKHKDDDLSSLLKGAEEQYSLFGEVCPDTLRDSFCQDEEVGTRRAARKSRDSPVPMEMDTLFDMDVLMSEFSDTLFSTLASHQSIGWPNPKEIAHAGNADMIQPGLIPLQPNLDFMDSFEHYQDLFHNIRSSVTPSSTPSVPSVAPVPSGGTSHTQASLLRSIDLPTDLPSVNLDQRISPDPISIVSAGANHSCQSSTMSAFSQTYMPLLTGPASVATVDPVAPPLLQTPHPGPTPLAHSILGQGSPVPPLAALECSQSQSVITHTASSTVTPSDAATTFSQSSGFLLPRASCRPAATPVVTTPVAHPLQPLQTFALPRPIQPAGAGKKTRHVKPIVPATSIPPSLILAPFPGSASTLIVTHPLKAEVVPTTGVALSSTAAGRAPHSGFHIRPQTQNPPQLIVPKEETGPSSSNCKTQTPPTNTVRDGRCSSQGSPCGPEQVPSPQSPHNSCTSLAKNEANQSRRVNHISAEQKRRFNINTGFKTLCGLVPTLKSQSNLKPISNAVTLQKTVEYIGKLQQERLQIQEETKRLREEIEELNSSINSCQEKLPATGVPITRQRFSHMQEKFDEYVKNRTIQNWKFWIFSIIIKPLFESFDGMVSTTSIDELCQTTLQWLEQHCALPVLRPMVLRTLRQLSINTSILSDPSLLPEEALQAVSTLPKQSG